VLSCTPSACPLQIWARFFPHVCSKLVKLDNKRILAFGAALTCAWSWHANMGRQCTTCNKRILAFGGANVRMTRVGLALYSVRALFVALCMLCVLTKRT
jgi:hypothetical protein